MASMTHGPFLLEGLKKLINVTGSNSTCLVSFLVPLDCKMLQDDLVIVELGPFLWLLV